MRDVGGYREVGMFEKVKYFRKRIGKLLIKIENSVCKGWFWKLRDERE